MAIKQPRAFIFAFAVLSGVGLPSCSPQDRARSDREGRAKSDSSQLVQAQYGMEFVCIPRSGKQWEDECRERDIVYKPVAGFYLQRRPLSLSQYREMRGDVEEHSSSSDLDGSFAVVIEDWTDAVNWGHFLSNNDTEFDYRLPTIYEWLYAYRYATSQKSSGLNELEFMEMYFEFATDSVLDIPLPIDAKAKYAPETARRSFAMGPPLYRDSDALSWGVVPNRTPPGSDDTINEQTFVRFVLVPKTKLNRSASSQ